MSCAKKNWTLSFFLRADLGYYRTNSYIMNTSSVENRANHFDTGYWTPSNPTNKYTRLMTTNSPSFTLYQNTSFVRLQDITLSYNIPSLILDKAKIKKARVYVNGKNVLTGSKWSGWDPESGNTPMPRIVTFSIDVTL